MSLDTPPTVAVVGLRPWLPWPLSRSRWWTEPVPAERLAALRIGLAAVLLWDLLTTQMPNLRLYFGHDGLGGAELFQGLLWPNRWTWSALAGAGDEALRWAMFGWVAATVCLLLGFLTRLSAAGAWLLSLSFAGLNQYIDNAGDQIRGIILFYLMLCPAGAAWSLDAWLRRRRGGPAGPVRVYPWPLRLLFLQLVLIYFLNGLYKLTGSNWIRGDSLYYVLCDLSLSRVSYAQLPIPYEATRLLTWIVLGWEAGFPLWIALRWTRKPALVLGVLFHLGILLTMELGGFAPYALTLYLPLVPWERLGRRPVARPLQAGAVSVTKTITPSCSLPRL
jgi:uncharacterized membrane protein YphA (DoxX/SURF4 family)